MNKRQISLRAKLIYAFALIPLMILVLAFLCLSKLNENTSALGDLTRLQLGEILKVRAQLIGSLSYRMLNNRLTLEGAKLESRLLDAPVRQLLSGAESTVPVTARGPGFVERTPADQGALDAWLASTLKSVGCSFLTVVGANGRTVARATNPAKAGDDLFFRDGGEGTADLKGLFEKATKGRTVVSIEALPAALLREELVVESNALQNVTNPGDTLADQARLAAKSYPDAAWTGEETRGLTLLAASPIMGTDGRALGVVFAGTVLNRNQKVIDEMQEPMQGNGFLALTLQSLRVLSSEPGEGSEKTSIGVPLTKELWQAFGADPNLAGDFQTGRGASMVKFNALRDHKDRPLGALMAVIPAEAAGRVLQAIESGGEQVRQDTKRVILQIGFIIIVLTLGVGLSLTGRITGPIQYLIDVSKAITEGNYGRRAEIDSGDEFGSLAAAFNVMAATINDKIHRAESLIKQIQESIRRLSTSTSEISAIVERQVSGATEQAASVNEVTTTSEEIAATARQISDNAASVKDIANEATRACGKGTDDITNAIQGMASLKDHVQSIAESMLVLGKNSQKIGEVINIIDEISKQTNLLSLNAAIEAAGAGEEGKRFAVVAVEVKRLADRTVDATKQIKQLIDMIQNSTNKTILLTEEGSKSVDAGFEMVEQVGKSLENIVTLVKKTARAANEISLSTGQQTTATDNMAQSISDVSRVAGQVLKSSEETRKSVGDINDLSESLRGLVSGDDANPGRPR